MKPDEKRREPGADTGTTPPEGLREALAEEFHNAGHCGYDHGTWAQIKTHGIECQCFEAADIALRALAATQRAPVEQGRDELQELKLSSEGGRSGSSHPVTLLSSPSPASADHAREGALREAAVEEYKKSLDVPELEDFAKGLVIEAQHQRQRWGDEHDKSKEPEEWFWLVGYLAGKGLRSQRDGDMEKFKHHLITGAALLANWHARVKSERALADGKEGGE